MTSLARTRSDELRSNLRGPLHSDRVNELALSLVVNIGPPYTRTVKYSPETVPFYDSTKPLGL